MTTEAYAQSSVMFILLLLITQVRCDWIEISQFHRKEPMHKITANFEFTTKSSMLYKNISSSEKQWNRGVVHKVSSVGNVKRVQFPSVKTSLKTAFRDDKFNGRFKNYTDSPVPLKQFNSTYALPEKQKASELTILHTSDVDNVKSIQSDINLKSAKILPVSNFNRRPIFHEEKQTNDTDMFNTNIGKQLEIRKNPFTAINDKEIDYSDKDKFYTQAKSNIRSVFHSNDDMKQRLPQHSERLNFNSSRKSNTQTIKLYVKENHSINQDNNVDENDITYNNKQRNETDLKVTDSGEIKYQYQKIAKFPVERVVHPNNNFDSSVSDQMERFDYTENSNNVELKTDLSNSNKKIDTTQYTNKKINEEPTSSKIIHMSKVTTGNAVKGIWKLLKIITDTIYKNTHTSIKSKIKYLERLKSTILSSIANQIDGAWPDDVPSDPIGVRRARSAQARGHLEFPSSESTLMTISFLTFAVFLIKLVLQVIHTYKNKTMMVTPAVVAAVRRAALKTRK